MPAARSTDHSTDHEARTGERDEDPPDPRRRADRPSASDGFGTAWVTAAGGVGIAVLAITAVVGWWTVSAAALPWIAGLGLVVIAPIVAAGSVRLDRPLGVPLAATFGGGVGLLAVVALLLAEPLAGMAGPVLPIVATLVGAAVGACAVGIGRRLRPRTAVIVVLTTVVVVPIVALLTAP